MTGGIDRVREYLAARGISARVMEFDSSTRNSQLAAEALGCTVGEIAKTIVFTGEKTAVVVLSGEKRVDSRKLSNLMRSKVRVASAEEVTALTGYAVGGVPPFPHNEGVAVYLDVSLLKYPKVWAAAGQQNAVVQLSVDELQEISGATVVEVSS